MTVSSSSAPVNGSSSTTAASEASEAVASPPPPPPDATTLRTFAVILCSECLYLEFPGCDVHGALYTERVAASASDGKPHAKCPSCTAATNNARPFREGCRRCKGPTTVSMWHCSQQEVEQAMEAFPSSIEEVAHTVVVCERCEAAIFPRSRETLTLRTPQEPMAANGRHLRVSNFQLSMPHVEGCTRKGMPVQGIAVQLPKSELKFVCERIERCPVAPRITGGPLYRPRELESITQQNHMHQVCIRLLTVVISAFDANSPRAVEPLRQVVAMLGKLEPLTLFSDWAPPRRLSQEQVSPTKVTSSSDFDTQHEASRALEKGSDYWRSGSKTPDKPSRSEEWLIFQFASAVTLSSVVLRWKPDFVASHFSVGISKDGATYETVAIVVERVVENRILLPKGTAIMSIKLTMFTSSSSSGTFGLESIECKEALFNLVHTSSGVLLQNIQHWLLDAAVSRLPDVRELALKALEKLLLASGSLCGLLQLATCLVLNSPTTRPASTAAMEAGCQGWDRLDLLSADGQLAAQDFLMKLARAIQQIVGNDRPSAGEKSLLDKHVMEKMSKLLHEEVGDPAQAVHPIATSPVVETNGQGNADGQETNKLKADELRVQDVEGDSSSACLVTFLISQQKFLHSIKRRSQLGMILLHMLSELSACQMKRMQKAEEFTGKREEELLCLEEPFSMEICPEFFAISHRILTKVLARWLPGSYVKVCLHPELHAEEEEKQNGTASNDNYCHHGRHGEHDVYQALAKSFDQFGTSLSGPESKRSTGSLDQSQGKHKSWSELLFSPDGLCVAVLQIITSNLRRLVLSRINPSDIGISPASVRNGDGLLSAPPALEPMVSSLEQLISLGTKRSDKFFPVSLKAAATMEVGMEAFYPSANQRTKVLASRMGKGATIEVQVRWPVQERDQEDPRYERLILMLQFECIKLGMRHAIRGSWFFFMHLVVEVPSTRDTEEVLTQHFAPCIQRAGFLSWQVAAGAQELSINLQRHLHWNRVEKMCHDSGAGWIRVYPADVAAFEEVCSDVEGFLEEHGKHEPSKPLP